MIDRSEVRGFVKRLVREFDPERVLLFGSYARGQPTEDSDVDVLVIMEHRKRRNTDQAIEIDLRLDREFPMDLIVRKPAEIRRRLALGDMFLKSIMEEGKVLYERRTQRMDRKG